MGLYIDTVTYAILLFGILRAGLVPFLVSPRNSASAVLHLLETSGTHHIFITEDHAVQKLIETAIINTKFPVFLHSITKEVVLSNVDRHTIDSSPAEFLSKDSTMVMHSSGTRRHYIIYSTHALFSRVYRFPEDYRIDAVDPPAIR